ncbi:hypothetical protein CSV71_12905 [Sporosarcina sp. P21c]|uniref:hypothetical protein n=1 Tax=unclassified Sporosarcina TaxID=2647733 RepID=UPI000C168B37|nr:MULTISPECIES: hypothetical protein [unclassified Sporosarcina]PIC66165.1 hypothetical protein CSV78_13965 [Sporosarcina sp. P16a]PIC88806.1 hypothetical protein CSV71_12905 [Sporosarcina sp. P21c]PIC91829.1 hypothetical protein CSV70_13635 [Sporosarcina sp. P25]
MEVQKLNDFLNELEKRKVFYKLSKIRSEAIMVEIAIPGQRWEVEFMEDGTIEIEKFMSEGGVLYNEKELKNLFKEFSD